MAEGDFLFKSRISELSIMAYNCHSISPEEEEGRRRGKERKKRRKERKKRRRRKEEEEGRG